MPLDDAFSLTSFIRQGAVRFAVGVLDFGNQGWVIVVDQHTKKNLEPVVDAEDYLRRARAGKLKISTDASCESLFLCLLTDWLAEQQTQGR